MSDPAALSQIEEYPLDDAAPNGMSPRRLLNVATALALVVVLLILAATQYQRFFPPPPFSGQNVYLDLGSQIEALDAQTGRMLWTKQQTGNMSIVATAQGLVIGQQNGQTLMALRSQSGVVVWRAALPSLGPNPCNITQVIMLDGVLLVACGFLIGSHRMGDHPHAISSSVSLAEVVALDPATGGILWHFRSYQAPYVLLAGAGSDIVVGEQGTVASHNLWVYAFDARSGAALWRTGVGTSLDELHFDATSGVVLARSGDTLLGIALVDGSKAWQLTVGQQALPPLVGPGVAYVDSFVVGDPLSSAITAVDLRTGAVRWNIQLGRSGYNGTMATAWGVVCYDDESNVLISLNPHNGASQWLARFTQPSVMVGITPTDIYLHSDDTLYAVASQTGVARWHIGFRSTPYRPDVVVLDAFKVTSIFVTNTDITAVATQTGSIRWHMPLAHAPTTAPLVGS